MTIPDEIILAGLTAGTSYLAEAGEAWDAGELTRVTLEAAAPHIAAAERERIRHAISALADEIDRTIVGGLTADDRLVATETLRELASEGRLQQLTEGTTT
jgi:hypothetical protein